MVQVTNVAGIFVGVVRGLACFCYASEKILFSAADTDHIVDLNLYSAGGFMQSGARSEGFS